MKVIVLVLRGADIVVDVYAGMTGAALKEAIVTSLAAQNRAVYSRNMRLFVGNSEMDDSAELTGKDVSTAHDTAGSGYLRIMTKTSYRDKMSIPTIIPGAARL